MDAQRRIGPMESRPAPVAPGERLLALDVLRGLALLGILAVNMAHFSSPAIFWAMAGIDPWDRPWDDAAQGLVQVLAEGKFYPLFSLLFGAGMVRFTERAAARGGPPGRLFARRLAVLLAIGALHALFVWSGDILLTYALVGFLLLLPFRRRTAKAALARGIGCIALALCVYALLVGPMMGTENPALVLWAREMADRSLAVYGSGSYAEQLEMRFIDLSLQYSNAVIYFPFILGIFLLGAAAAKVQLIERLPATRPLVRRTGTVGLVVGLPLAALAAYADARLTPGVTTAYDLLAFLGYALGGLALALWYASAIVLLVERPAWRRRLAPLAAAGRMALTNYLLQSLVCTTLFYSYGLGLYGRVGPAGGLLLTLAIFGGQLAFSAWWLRRFRFGPVEWLWRTLTYGRRQPLRDGRET
ncbi:DUF418 domain-containing protein [Calditerricola satsumensis]|nr:DUF418 domain-containing protein [Calditerricola satsumensis]